MGASKSKTLLPSDYGDLLQVIKESVQENRSQAYRAVNKWMIELYWDIGQEIAYRQERDGWGKSWMDRLSKDLRHEFPGPSGFSAQNLWLMRQIYFEYREHPHLLQLVRELPWNQNIAIMTTIEDIDEREYYLRKTVEMAWSRDFLLHQIRTDAYHRHRSTSEEHNFQDAVPSLQAQQQDQAIPDVYTHDFLGTTRPVMARELKERLLNRTRHVLLESGQGFAFMGSQFPLTRNEEQHYIDLLFYHRILKCLVAIELKTEKSRPNSGGKICCNGAGNCVRSVTLSRPLQLAAKYSPRCLGRDTLYPQTFAPLGNQYVCNMRVLPEDTGKMNSWLHLLNCSIREPEEDPAIGIILYADKNRLEVEYSLKRAPEATGGEEYRFTRELPSQFDGKLPEAEELEREISRELGKEG